MVAPPNPSELSKLLLVKKVSDDKIAECEARKRKLLAANKEAARALLLGISLSTSASKTTKDIY